MRVTVEHRQRTTGLGSAQSQCVKCTVLFSEEKAIIGLRGLRDHIVVLDPPSPPPSFREWMTAGVLLGLGLLLSSIFLGGGYAVFGGFLCSDHPSPGPLGNGGHADLRPRCQC
jgi:hypothetical protein